MSNSNSNSDAQPKVVLIAGITGQDGSYLGRQGDKVPVSQVGEMVVRISPRYFRPIEVEVLPGDPTKHRLELGWVPHNTAKQMCEEMVASDLAQAQQHALLKKHGYTVIVGGE